MRPEGSRRERDALLRNLSSEELQASLIVHDDGRKEWDWIRHEWQGSGDLKTMIEQAADADPQAERWTYQTFTIRQNQSL
jgi:hypothetical protein